VSTDTDAPPYHPAHDEPPAEHVPAPTSSAAVAGRRTSAPPPHDTDAEEAVLGAMLWTLDACDAAIETGLEPEHFYVAHHQAWYAAACACLAAGEKPDPITVNARTSAPSGDQINRLQALVISAPVSTSAGTYARRVQHCARLRQLAAATIEISDTARSGDLDRALDQLHRLTTNLPTDDTDTSWAPVDLAAIRTGDTAPGPTMLARDDGLCLLYTGKVHAFNAEPESGKSWLALWATAERILAGEHVVYLDFEDDGATIDGRLQALGLEPDQIDAGLSYIHPHDPVDAVATAQLERVLAEHHPTLVVIDGVTEVMSINGWSINDNDDIARFFLALPKRIARHGPAVVLIDHVVKDKESRGRYGIGGQHKLAGIDGATYTLEVTRPWGLGLDGASRISVTKDRPGHVRGGSLEGRFVGEFRGQSIDGGAMHCSLSARSHTGGAPARTRPTNLMEQVSKAVRELNEAGVEPTKNAVANEVPSKKANVLIAIDQLVSERFLSVVAGANNARHLRSLRPYSQAMDPESDAWVGTERTPEGDL
jgi:hypothetical protein